MEHTRIIELITRKLAGEATAAELYELQGLLREYPEGIYYEEALKQLWQNNSTADYDTDQAYSAHKLKYADEFQPAKQVHFFSKYKSRLLPVAAITLIAMACSLWFFMRETTQQNLMEIVSGSGIRKTVILPDGSKVWLNASSKIKFDASMNDKPTRSVYLSGEAFFDVTENKRKPFIIKTDKVAIKVLGTSFNVKAYTGEENTETTLIEGMIEFNLLDRPEQKLILKPHEKLAVNELSKSGFQKQNVKKNRQLVIESIKPVTIGNRKYIEETSWTENKLVFENETLRELLPRLQRWYNVKIDVKDAQIMDYNFTGVLEKETLEEALSAMKLIRPFNFKIVGNNVILN
jgi:transmembrane sensor